MITSYYLYELIIKEIGFNAMKIMHCFLLFLLSVAALKATPGEDMPYRLDSIQALNEVVVTAQRTQDVLPSQNLSGDELGRLSVLSVADAVRYFSGVQVKDYGGIGGLKTIDIRSMGSNHAAVFYDGLQIGNAQSGQIDLGRFSLDNIEEINLYNGQKSNLLQPAKDFGSAGTVYLQTRRPRFQSGKDYNLTAKFRTGSFGLLNPSILYEQRLSDNVSASLNIEYVDASGKYKFRHRRKLENVVVQDTTATRKNGDVEALRMEANLNGRLDRGRWNLKAYYYNSERGIPGAVVGNSWGDEDFARQWDENFFLQGSLRKELFAGHELMINTKYANDYLKNNPDTSFAKSKISRFTQDEYYASLANRYAINPHWQVSFSADYQRNGLKASSDIEQASRDMLFFSLATSFEWDNLRALGSVLATRVDDKTQGKKEDFSKTVYTPGVFLSFVPMTDKGLSLRAFAKKSFRMPSFNDLYYTDVSSDNIKPEYATQYNIGAQWDFLKDRPVWQASLSADVYYNRVKDKIIAIPNEKNLSRWTVSNCGVAKIKGIDLSSQASCLDPLGIFWRIHLQYTYQEAKDYSEPLDKGVDGGTWGGQLPYIPRHSGSAGLSAQYRSWDMNYSFIYTGERYSNSANVIENYRKPWYTSDISLGKSFRYRKLDFRITAEVNNLLDQQYAVIRNYPMPGRNYRLSLKIDL